MKPLEDLIARLRVFEAEMIRVIEEVVREHDYIILDMNAEDQLFERGINREGIAIADYAPYAPFTIEIKKLKGQPTTRVTLRDEGDFHSSFFIDFQDGGFQIKASDWKANKLMFEYGDEILGLTDSNFKEFADYYVKPALTKLLKQL